MYAIVDIAGKQYRVGEQDTIFVPRLDVEVGQKVKFEDVLLVNKDGDVAVGTPHVKGAVIDAKVLDHVKGDKVVVFKKKRRKGYRVKNGHRQPFTQLEIIKIKA
jgi:large subunit ribosomal protein L21